jgi:hypothetical protein
MPINLVKKNELFSNRIAKGWQFETRLFWFIFIWKRRR